MHRSKAVWSKMIFFLIFNEAGHGGVNLLILIFFDPNSRQPGRQSERSACIRSSKIIGTMQSYAAFYYVYKRLIKILTLKYKMI